MATVHCIGALVVDALSGPLPEYPVPKVRTQINTESVRFMTGGGAANTGSALAQMGIRTTIFSKVGGDLNGDFLRRELKKNGVDISQIRVAAQESTPFTFVGIHPDGDRSFIHTPGANLSFARRDLDLERLYDCEFLLYQDMFVLPKLDGAGAAKLLAGAKRRGITTLLDECFGLGPKRKIFETVLPFCDVAIPSCDDMQAIYPGMKAVDIARHLRARGARRVVLKLGTRGCLVATEKETALVPTLARRIVDTTGAGDCFNAGFIAGLINGMSDLQAARIGAAAAAACIAYVGGAVGIPSFKKLLKMAKAFS
ncbi:MAG TPA: carbohydrate kinase family protein [Candidatus Limnocylindrales bacterium]|nr:carbohydrate kinase family protein [Candidatus Limnocylindrales bacterium]